MNKTLLLLLILLFLTVWASAQNWEENNGKREWAQAPRTKVKISHQLEMISWPGLPDSTYFKIDVGSITDSIWYLGDTTTIGINEYYYARFYNVGDAVLEWEAILHQKPGNQYRWIFPMESENLDFFYQRALTPEEIAEGYRQPDSVTGSYAVYHSSKKWNEYKTGKAFHIYRPKVYDSAGDTVWLDLSIDTVASTITLEGTRQWFRDAAYPVTIDPTFGYTSVGANTGNMGSSVIRGWKMVTNDAALEGAQVDSIRFYINSFDGVDFDMVWGIYSTTTNDTINTRLSYQTSGETYNSTGWNWTSNSFTTYAISNSTAYGLVELSNKSANPDITGAFDWTGAMKSQMNSAYDYSDYDNLPSDFGTLSNSTNKVFSIYASCTSPVRTRRRHILLGGQ